MPDEQKYTLRQTGSVIQQLLDSIQSQSSDISAKADRNYVDSALATKVDKETGKGLSSNDYTTADRQKLAGIAANAQVNVPSDWNATTGDARILNKPDLSVYPTRTEMNQAIAGVSVDLSAYSTTTQMNSAIAASAATKVDKVDGKGLSSNDFTDAERTKLGTIESGAQANVPSDWDAISGPARILNKPTIPVVNNATLTIRMNRENKGTFTANSATNTIIDLGVITPGTSNIAYVVVDTLPTASADTMNKIYLVPQSQGSSTRNQYWTIQSGSTYSWEIIGTTEVTLDGVIYLGDVVESVVITR